MKNFFSFLFGLAFHNLLLKLLCLGLAFLLFVYVNTSESLDKEFLVPISIANRPPNLLVTSQSATEARVVAYGPKAKMDQLKASDLGVTLSLTNRQLPGEKKFELYTDQVSVPPGIRVRSIQPTSVTLRLETIAAKTVPIRAVVEGSPREGYEVVDVHPTNEEIEVAGPPSVLSRLAYVETEAVDVEGMTGRFKQRVRFRTPNLVSLSERRSTIVAITIREKIIERTLEGVPLQSRSARPNVELDPPEVAVELRGPYSLVQALTRDRLQLTVEEEELEPGQSALRPVSSGELPPQVEVQLVPDEVLVTVPESAPAPEAPAEREASGPGPRE